MMPGISGMALADESRTATRSCAERMLFMSGGTGDARVRAVPRAPRRRALPKPLDMKLLLRMLRGVRDHARART